MKPVIGTFDLSESDFIIYPNPTAEIITVLNPGNPLECTLTLFNLNGQQILADKMFLESGPNTIYLGNKIPSGMYILEIRTKYNTEKLKLILR